MNLTDEIIIREKPVSGYRDVWEAMIRFNGERDVSTMDEIWCLQHKQVFTLGMAGDPKHIIHTSDIPVINSDRGGQVTYHAPGQLIVYLLLDLKRKQLMVKKLVNLLEQSVIDFCHLKNIDAERQQGAPGIYVNGKKLAALGIRVKHGCSYHGLALNVDMDLVPYRYINPCGYAGLEVTQLKDLGCQLNVDDTAKSLIPCLLQNLGYKKIFNENSHEHLMIENQKIVAAL